MLGSTEKKLLFMFFIATTVVLGMVSAVSLLSDRYETAKIAEQRNEESANIALRLISHEIQELRILAADYARWDDTYDYINNPNTEFTQENFSLDALDSLEIDAVAILDSSMEILFSEGALRDLSKLRIEQHLDSESPESQAVIQSGALLHNNHVILFSSAPVQDSFEALPHNGRLVFFKRVDLAMMDRISSTIAQSLSFHVYSDDVRYIFLSRTEAWAVGSSRVEISDNQIVGTYTLAGLGGENLPVDIILGSMFEPRSLQSFLIRLMPYIIALLTLPFIMISLLRSKITAPTRELIKWLNQVDGSQLAEELKPFKHADKGEIGELSQQFSSIYNNLYQQHQFSQILLYSISDFIFTVDHNGNIDYCNPAATEWLNVSANQLYGQSFEFLVANLSEDTPSPSNWLYRAIHNASEYSGISLIRKFGEETLSEWMEIQVSPMIKSDDEPMGALVILRPKADYTA